MSIEDKSHTARQFGCMFGIDPYEVREEQMSLSEWLNRPRRYYDEVDDEPREPIATIIYTKHPDGTITEEIRRVDKETPEGKPQEA